MSKFIYFLLINFLVKKIHWAYSTNPHICGFKNIKYFIYLAHSSNVTFAHVADFSNVTFAHFTDFSKFTFAHFTDFSNVTFAHFTDFSNVTFAHFPDFSNVTTLRTPACHVDLFSSSPFLIAKWCSCWFVSCCSWIRGSIGFVSQSGCLSQILILYLIWHSYNLAQNIYLNTIKIYTFTCIRHCNTDVVVYLW